jgi:hypothetical protein
MIKRLDLTDFYTEGMSEVGKNIAYKSISIISIY